MRRPYIKTPCSPFIEDIVNCLSIILPSFPGNSILLRNLTLPIISHVTRMGLAYL